MIGIVIPACNEEQYLEECLRSIHLAIHALPTLNKEVRVLVVLDSCTDQSLQIVLHTLLLHLSPTLIFLVLFQIPYTYIISPFYFLPAKALKNQQIISITK